MGLHVELAVNVLAAAIGIALVVVLIGQWRAVRKVSREMEYLEEQLARALRQIESRDEVEILTGFQTLTKLNDRRTRLRALERIRKLKQHENAFVARQAGKTYDTIVSDLEKAEA